MPTEPTVVEKKLAAAIQQVLRDQKITLHLPLAVRYEMARQCLGHPYLRGQS